MHTIKFDLKHGLVLIDSTPIAVDEQGDLASSIKKLCSSPIRTDERTRYRISKKVTVYGKSAEGVIEVGDRRICTITFLFDFIEFFESSILESKILKACEKSLNVQFKSNHPSRAFLDSFEWGHVIYFYDAKQGDLSLEFNFECRSVDPILNP